MISSLKLLNFKCFRQQSIRFSNLTLLTGINGMGKSTVLQSFLLLRQSYLQGTLPSKGLLINGNLADLGTAGDILYRGAEQDEIGIEIGTGESAMSWRFRYDDQFANVMQVLKSPDNVAGCPVFDSQFHYLMAERIGPRSMYEMSAYAVQQENHIGKDGRYAIAYLETFAQREVSAPLRLISAAANNVRSQVEAWVGEITPGARITVQPYPELRRLTLGMTFSAVPTPGRPFSAPNVGFGLSYVLPIVVAVLASPTGSMILVENPEAHLNPKGQVAMGRLLSRAADAGLQIIVETHSDHLLNGIRIATKQKEVAPEKVAIHFFDRDGNEHTVHSPILDADGRIESWPRGFFDQWEHSLDTLLG